jgi:hypothetical protein
LWLKSLADATIDLTSKYTQIFTDASKLSTGEVACAIVIRTHLQLPLYEISLRLTDRISIYKAELFAIYYALMFF